MPFSHLLLALLVVFVWGINFIFVKLSLEEFSPLLLCAVRFLLASVPAVFFIKPPAVPFKIIAGYGLIMFALQFALLFIGLRVGMTPGVASLLMQVQVFFSMFFAIIFLGEQPQVADNRGFDCIYRHWCSGLTLRPQCVFNGVFMYSCCSGFLGYWQPHYEKNSFC